MFKAISVKFTLPEDFKAFTSISRTPNSVLSALRHALKSKSPVKPEYSTLLAIYSQFTVEDEYSLLHATLGTPTPSSLNVNVYKASDSIIQEFEQVKESISLEDFVKS